jgi:hypothetical protein
MDNERLVFTEDTPQQYVKLVASGVVSAELLGALEAYVKRQRARLKKADASPKPSEAQDQEEGGLDYDKMTGS